MFCKVTHRTVVIGVNKKCGLLILCTKFNQVAGWLWYVGRSSSTVVPLSVHSCLSKSFAKIPYLLNQMPSSHNFVWLLFESGIY